MIASAPLHIVVMDNSEVVADHFRNYLKDHPVVSEISTLMYHQHYLNDLMRINPDVVLVNRTFYSDDFQDLLTSVRTHCPEMVIIVCVDDCSEEYREQCIKRGAHFVYDRLKDLSEVNKILFKIQQLIK